MVAYNAVTPSTDGEATSSPSGNGKGDVPVEEALPHAGTQVVVGGLPDDEDKLRF